MPTYDELAAREDARRRRTYDALTRVGHDYVLPLRWVDVMPQVSGPSMAERLDELRARRVEIGVTAYQVRIITTDEERRLERARSRYTAEQAQLRGGLSREEWAAKQQEEQLRGMTDRQRARHDYYMSRRDEVLENARNRAAARRRMRGVK